MTGPGPRAIALLGTPTWPDILLGALVQWLIFVPLLGVLLALAFLPAGASAALFIALFSPLYSAIVGAAITMSLGVPLAKLLAGALARNTKWRAHLAAFLGLGAILATLLLHLYMLLVGYLWNSEAWWSSMPIFVPIVSAAALSVGAGWSIAWRRAVVRGRTPEKRLALVAD